jgi:hypothetical protein
LAVSPLAQFPKKVLNALTEAVIEERAAMLEIYLRVAALDTALWPTLRAFLGVPVDADLRAEETEETVLSPGELLIVSLQSRMRRDVSNKVSSLAGFSLKFFSKQQSISRKYASILMSELIPLCGDQICGSLALDLVSKLVSPAATCCARQFLHVLTRYSPKELAAMKLDKHILGTFPGDSIAQAFALISLLSEHITQSGAVLQVLNGSFAAVETFGRWKSGEIEPHCEVQGEGRWRRSDSADMPELAAEYKADKGVLEVSVAMEGISASANRIAECIFRPENRKYWDSFVKGARTVTTLSSTASVVELLYEDTGRLYPCITHCTVDCSSTSEITITYRLWTTENTLGPYVASYHIEQSADHVSFWQTASDTSSGGESITSQDTSTPLFHQHIDCNLRYKARFTGDLMRIRLEDFANGRQAFMGIWKSLKGYAETEHFQGQMDLKPALDVACSNKILAPRGTTQQKGRISA